MPLPSLKCSTLSPGFSSREPFEEGEFPLLYDGVTAALLLFLLLSFPGPPGILGLLVSLPVGFDVRGLSATLVLIVESLTGNGLAAAAAERLTLALPVEER